VTTKKLLFFIYVFAFLTRCSYWKEPTRAEIDELKAKLESAKVGEIVQSVYEDREFRPIWIARERKLDRLQQFFQLVDDRSHGLHPEDFNIDPLRQEKHSDLIQFDIDVTWALARYASALAFGRIDPKQIDPDWIGTRREIDLKKVLDDAIEYDSVAQLADRLAPKHAEYDQLRAALQNASGDQARQIELNLDRWRWLPDEFGKRHIRVNIPSFDLEVRDDRQIPLQMKVVVGSNDNRTPIFSSEMKYVVFSPYWNIPESITTKETLPHIMKDPKYATRQNLEVVRVSGKHVEVVDPRDIDWKNVGESDIQLRQKPGDQNSLGLIKFIFPNRFNVYLHDTPENNLFDRLTRNFSHGCIRVEKPQELAEVVLRDPTVWTPDRIQKAMHAGDEQHVALKEPLPVHILYFTAWVDDGGMVHFEKDIYGYDAKQTNAQH
jgi:murein L,D-transpeptidase YcbB/YkuD